MQLYSSASSLVVHYSSIRRDMDLYKKFNEKETNGVRAGISSSRQNLVQIKNIFNFKKTKRVIQKYVVFVPVVWFAYMPSMSFSPVSLC